MRHPCKPHRTEKGCATCNRTLPINQFITLDQPHENGTTYQVRSSYCNACRSLRMACSNHCLTIDEFILLFGRGACHICGSLEKTNVDHDHVTGQIRGLLCAGCNIAVGVVEREDMSKYAAYVNYHRDRPSTDPRNQERLAKQNKREARACKRRTEHKAKSTRVVPTREEMLSSIDAIKGADTE